MKRRILIFALFLLTGAAVNLAVAWSCALWSDPVSGEPKAQLVRDERDRPTLFFHQAYGFGTLTMGVWSSAGAHPSRLAREAAPPLESRLPSWAREPKLNRFNMHAYTARGWPFLSMWCVQEAEQSVQYTYVIHGGWQVAFRPIKSGWRTTPRAIPLRPIWSGVATNTLIYAVALWVLICGPFAFRRALRRRRNLCVNCGYNLHGVVHDRCPECGARA